MYMDYTSQITSKNALEYTNFLMEKYDQEYLVQDDRIKVAPKSELGSIDYTIFLKPKKDASQKIILTILKSPGAPSNLYEININNGTGSGWTGYSKDEFSDVAKIFEKVRILAEDKATALVRRFLETAYMVLVREGIRSDGDFGKRVNELEELWKNPLQFDVSVIRNMHLLKGTYVQNEFNQIITDIDKFLTHTNKGSVSDREWNIIQAKILFFIGKANKKNIATRTAHNLQMAFVDGALKAGLLHPQYATNINPLRHKDYARIQNSHWLKNR